MRCVPECWSLTYQDVGVRLVAVNPMIEVLLQVAARRGAVVPQGEDVLLLMSSYVGEHQEGRKSFEGPVIVREETSIPTSVTVATFEQEGQLDVHCVNRRDKGDLRGEMCRFVELDILDFGSG